MLILSITTPIVAARRSSAGRKLSHPQQSFDGANLPDFLSVSETKVPRELLCRPVNLLPITLLSGDEFLF